MTDLNVTRQRVQAAREHIKKFEWGKARALLKGLEHPKAQALLAEVETQLASQKSKSAGFPVLRVVGFLVIFVGLLGGGGLLLSHRNTPSVMVENVPTISPTEECNEATVQTWWRVQDFGLADFASNASALGLSDFGERYDRKLDELKEFRENFPPLPSCASAELGTAISDLLVVMDATISNFEGQRDNTIDPTTGWNAEYDNERALRSARSTVREIVLP
jgi:hypothetical protein